MRKKWQCHSPYCRHRLEWQVYPPRRAIDVHNIYIYIYTAATRIQYQNITIVLKVCRLLRRVIVICYVLEIKTKREKRGNNNSNKRLIYKSREKIWHFHLNNRCSFRKLVEIDDSNLQLSRRYNTLIANSKTIYTFPESETPSRVNEQNTNNSVFSRPHNILWFLFIL